MKYPLAIIATPRTGTNVYGSKMSQEYGLQYFSEPTLFLHNPNCSPKNILQFERLKEYVSKGIKQFVLRIMGYQYFDTPIFQNIFEDNNCYKIKMIRKNQLEQIASFYIAKQRDVWWSGQEYASQFDVDINKQIIKDIINDINIQKQTLDDLNLQYDEVISYEKMVTTLSPGLGFDKQLKPNNYADLLKEIEKQL